MLRADSVSFAYGATRVVAGVDLRVESGGFVGLLGPNGAGKTTLLRLLSGTLRPSTGRVLLDGVDLASMPRPALARRMAVVPQETHLAFDYSVLEIALMGRYPHLGPFEIEGPRDLEIAREALEATGTRGFEDRPFATLSGGEKQRVIIAAALAQIDRRGSHDERGPGILLLDEPTASLDLGYQLDLAGLLIALQRQRPLAIVISTHELGFAASLCRELILLRGGRVLAFGPTDAVLTPDRIRILYGVDVDIRRHEGAGHLVVVPLRRTSTP